MTIYDDIKRLQTLAGSGTSVPRHAAEARAGVVHRADEALRIIGSLGTLTDLIEEFKSEATRLEDDFVRLNGLLTSVIKEEATRMMGNAG